jgi:hypothetical protein
VLYLQAHADQNIVRPSNISPEATRQALQELDEQTRKAQEKYDQDMLDQSNSIQQSIQYKAIEEERLRQILATRPLSTGPSESLIPASIEQIIRAVDPGLPISYTTNQGVIRYKIGLKDWAQREQIYNALDQIQKLGVSSVKDPRSVTVAVDQRSLVPPPLPALAVSHPQFMQAQSVPITRDQPPRGLLPLSHDLPFEAATMPEPKSNLNLITLTVLGTLALCSIAVIGLWRLRRRDHPLIKSSEEHSLKEALYELRSDAELQIHTSVQVRRSCGFRETCRAVHFIKPIAVNP